MHLIMMLLLFKTFRLSSRDQVHNWTNRQNSLTAHYLRCCFNHSEMPEAMNWLICYNSLPELSLTIGLPVIRCQEVMILFSLTHGMETVLHAQIVLAIFRF